MLLTIKLGRFADAKCSNNWRVESVLRGGESYCGKIDLATDSDDPQTKMIQTWLPNMIMFANMVNKNGVVRSLDVQVDLSDKLIVLCVSKYDVNKKIVPTEISDIDEIKHCGFNEFI